MTSETLGDGRPLPAAAPQAAGFSISSRPEGPATLLRRLWQSQELIAVLARREFYVRFKRAILGVVWAIAVPALQAAVMIVVFSRIVPISTGKPYITFVFAGTAVWSFFAAALGNASTAIVDGVSLASKIYFPRAVLPLVSVGASIYGLAVGLAILGVVDAVDTGHIGVEILLLLPGAGLLVVLAAGLGLVTSALHVYLRDVRFLVQAALLVWIYITPIFYPLTRPDAASGILVSTVQGPLRAVVLANPLTGIVELFRAATIGADSDIGLALVASIGWAAAALVLGVLVQSRFDRRFADLL